MNTTTTIGRVLLKRRNCITSLAANDNAAFIWNSSVTDGPVTSDAHWHIVTLFVPDLQIIIDSDNCLVASRCQAIT